jgi:hypothetical protein
VSRRVTIRSQHRAHRHVRDCLFELTHLALIAALYDAFMYRSCIELLENGAC